MSYQVIARKWRPQTFDELVGQSHISRTLLNALKSDRVPHALLFTGPRGTGKTSSARILAKALRCPNAKDFVPCGQCDDCNEIAEARSVNVIEIDGASNNGVDAIRELRDSVGYMPSTGRYKVYIIDEVHMLSSSAFNALLKTLEEPPGHVVFILATTEVHKIPNTILSRCQRFDFRRIPLRSVAERLANICREENVEADEQGLWAIARQGDGSMRDSLSLLDQVISFGSGRIQHSEVVEILGLTDRQLLGDTLEALMKRDLDAVVEIVDRLFTSGTDPKLFVHELLEEIRHLLLIKVAPEQSLRLVDLAPAEVEHLTKLVSSVSEEDIHLLFDMALKGANEIPRAQDPRIVLEMLLLRMARAPRIENLSAMSTPTARSQETPAPMRTLASTTPQIPRPRPEARSEARPAAVTTPMAAPEPKPTGPIRGTPQEQWADLVGKIARLNGLFAAQLEHTSLGQINGKNLTVLVPGKMKFLMEKLNEPEAIKRLTTYISTFWGQGYTIAIQLTAEREGVPSLSPKELERKRREDEESDIRRQVENHPLVKATRDVFKSDIHSIKESP